MLVELYAEARALDLDVLVEVHDEEELDCALERLDADVIGINNRDLTDFSVDIQRTFELLADIPAGKTVVSESGFYSREQLDELERVGVDGVLVGESLMRARTLGVRCCALLTGRRRRERLTALGSWPLQRSGRRAKHTNLARGATMPANEPLSPSRRSTDAPQDVAPYRLVRRADRGRRWPDRVRR